MLSFYSSKILRNSLSVEKVGHQVCLYGGAVFALVLALNVMPGLFTLWWSDETLKGLLLVPLFTGVLLYQQRDELRRLTLNVCWPVYLASLGIGGFAWWVSSNDAIRLGGLLFVASMGLLFVSCFGKASLAVIWRPLLFLCTMVPATPNFLDAVTLGLQHIFSLFVDLLAPLLDDSYFGRDGFMHWFMGGKRPIGISAECSGLRSMMGMVIVAWYLSIADRLSLGKTVAMIHVAVALALVLNLVRIITTIELDLNDLREYTQGRWHGLLGIFVCLTGIVLLSKLSNKLQD